MKQLYRFFFIIVMFAAPVAGFAQYKGLSPQDSIVSGGFHVYHTTCVNYEWNGILYDTTGDYTDTLNNVTTGGDSVVTLHLTINNTTYGDTVSTVCDSCEWHGKWYASTGDYLDTLYQANSVGGDSVVTLHLTIKHSNTGDTSAIVCESFTWHEITYTESGDYTQRLTNASGCDSMVTLHLTVGHSNTGDTTAFACNSFDWYEHTNITSSTNSLTHTFTNASGCDSVVTLKLTVGHSNTGDTTAFACDRFDWYEHTNITSSTNSLTHTFTNASGCDSVVTLKLTVGHSNTGDTTAFSCNSFDWYEHTNITSSCDNLTHTFTNASGCDSVVTLKLTVGHSNTGDTTAFACNSFTWYGTTYTSTPAVAPTHTFTNASGCDSVVTLHLTIFSPDTLVFADTACNFYNWNDSTYTETGDYTQCFKNFHGCDSVVTLHLTINYTTTSIDERTACGSYTWIDGQTYLTSTNTPSITLTNSVGCDSIVTLFLTINDTIDTKEIVCKKHSDANKTPYMLVYPDAGLLYQWYKNDTILPGETKQYYLQHNFSSSDCYKVRVARNLGACGGLTDCCGCISFKTEKMRIIPNPNNGQFQLMLPEDAESVQILNSNGQIVMARKVMEPKMIEMGTGLANGLYFVKVFLKDGSYNTEKLIINR